MKFKNARLNIWYTDNYGRHHEPQGKIYQKDGKWIYLADMTPSTLWKSFNGYSIADQILDGFSKAKLKVQIIYRIKTQNQLLYATPSLFKKKGIKRNFGGHEQWILCLNYWEIKQGDIVDPKDLKDMDLSDWLKGEQEIQWNNDGSFSYV